MKPDQLTQQECLDFIRLAIFRGNQTAASILATEIKGLCESGYVNRHKIWAQLSEWERERFRELVAGE